MGWRMTFLVTALVGIPVLLAQMFLLPRLHAGEGHSHQ